MGHNSRMASGLNLATALRRFGPIVACAAAALPVALMAERFGIVRGGSDLPGGYALFLGLLAAPILEELAFRGAIQPAIASKLNPRLTGHWLPSAPNIITSVLFSSLHLWNHTPLAAAATFLPSLVFGYLKDRFDSLLLPIGMHIWYNAALMLVLLV